MNEQELQDLHERFERAAFYYDNGIVYCKTNLRQIQASPCIVVTHNDWAHEWHKDYLGAVFMGELRFHKRCGVQFLHNVVPVRLKNGFIIRGKMIRAECIRVID